MFNSGLKKDALAIHEQTVERYNASYETMISSCHALYEKRNEAIRQIEDIQRVINSIANSPKDFETRMGQIRQELLKFRKTEEYAEEAFKGELKSGAGIASGVAIGGAIASLGPTAAMQIATTFGTSSTGTAISILHGAAAQKAAIAWLGRVTGGVATKGVITGAGMASGQALLALAGPIGWGLSAAMAGTSLISMSKKNKKVSEEAIEEVKKIMIAKESVDETNEKIKTLTKETRQLLWELSDQAGRVHRCMNANYLELTQEEKMMLGTVVNNTLSLACLVNRTLE